MRTSAQEMVTVQLCIRKPGVAGAQNPHGVVKIELRQPRSMRRTWEESQQFPTPALPHAPNLNVVFDGSLIKPRQIGEVRPSTEGISDTADVHQLEARREVLLVDVARLQAQLDSLSELHLKQRTFYAQEEQRVQENIRRESERLQQGIAKEQELLDSLRAAHKEEQESVHKRVQATLESQTQISRIMRDHVQKYETDLTSAVNHEAKLANDTANIIAEQRAKGEGTLPERMLNRAAGHALEFLDTDLGKALAKGVAHKFGVQL